MKIFLFGLAVLLISVSAIAQKAPIKFGKLDESEMTMVRYEKDSNASAVVLCDYGTTRFEYYSSVGIVNIYERTTRIKILTKEGYKHARFEIPIYRKYDDVNQIKGFTYNSVNGKIEKQKLTKDQIFKEEYDKYWDIVKFEMPSVSVGSVIEITYSIQSERSEIRNWYFQWEIPVVHSEYRVSYPEYYQYKQLEKGYFPISQRENDIKPGYFMFSDGSKIDFQEYYYRYVSNDVPAFYEEAFTDCAKNYLSSIDFEIGSVRWPNRPIKSYTNTWSDIGKMLMDDNEFGIRLKHPDILKPVIESIKVQNLEPLDRAQKLYTAIQKHMNWNGRNSIYSIKGSPKTWDDGHGTSGEINLMLTAGLIELGLDAHPVILSTRSYGRPHPAQIILDQYNYTIAAIKHEGKIILLDATDKFAPMGVLPFHCLNGEGRLIDRTGGTAINLNPTAKNEISSKLDLSLSPNGDIKGNYSEKFSGYGFMDKMNERLSYNTDEDFFAKHKEEEYKELNATLDSISTNSNGEFIISGNFEASEIADKAGNLIIINPVLIHNYESNPFKLAERTYPVNFGYPFNTSYLLAMNIPDGYAVESVPETKRFALPNQAGSYMQTVSYDQNKIIVITKLDMKQTLQNADMYASLKTFYETMIGLQNTPIVLKQIE